MNLFKKKRPEKKILYEKFKNSQISETSLKEEPDKKADKEEKKHRTNPNQTTTIAICSMTGHMGSSYISLAIALYIKAKLKKKVCIVDTKIASNLKEGEEKGIPILPFSKLYGLYDKYNYIILDCSDRNTISLDCQNEVKRADKKILISLIDDNNLSQLADFIRNEENISKWKFIFNHVPENKKNMVYDLMEDYECYCFSTFDIGKLDKESNKTMKQLMKR